MQADPDITSDAPASACADTAPVQVARHGAVLWLTLQRPDALNALNAAMVTLIDSALTEAQDDPGVRALVIAGAGRAFCVGADLGDARDADAARSGDASEAGECFLDAVQALFGRIETFPIPVIGALNGLTLGAGLEIALCCDIVVATESARIGDGHARYGLLPGGGASARLPRAVPMAAAKMMMFTGELFSSAQAVAWGLVQAVYPDDRFRDEVYALAERIASRSPLGLRRMKQLLGSAPSLPLPEALASERAMLREHRRSFDRREGLQAFAQKRAPRFEGR